VSERYEHEWKDPRAYPKCLHCGVLQALGEKLECPVRLRTALDALRADAAQQAADAALGRALRECREAWKDPFLYAKGEEGYGREVWRVWSGPGTFPTYREVGHGSTELEALTAATAAARGKD
jgi:hypothetical protein